ncbi:MAG: hypothetical protein D6721_04935 [Gammaproteobacteria bacterium]|nr:MAG: hypothetical protein D6721_04935 [Gammaproteobacteria bacterium]
MPMPGFESLMERANRLLHLFIALALLVASLLVVWQFLRDAWAVLQSGAVVRGFLQALGNLFILWVLSSLISAEVRYMKTGIFRLVVFIEVALITLLRQLILIPVESAGHLETAIWSYSLTIVAILALGLTYWLVNHSQLKCRMLEEEDAESRGDPGPETP